MTLWLLKNPMTLHILLTLQEDGTIRGKFPALPGCAAQGNTIDEAVLNLAIAIQDILAHRVPALKEL